MQINHEGVHFVLIYENITLLAGRLPYAHDGIMGCLGLDVAMAAGTFIGMVVSLVCLQPGCLIRPGCFIEKCREK